MRSVRIYQPGEYLAGESIALGPTASQHVGTVLRMQAGEALTLFCGDNREFTAIIVAVTKKSVEVRITDIQKVSRESPCVLHLAQVISKGERMEFVVQKAVELGVASITPLFSERCVVRLDAERLAKKEAQWQAIAIASSEQSGRNLVPIIHKTCLFERYLETVKATSKLILHPHTQTSWREQTHSGGDIALIVGPEGGFTEAETKLAATKQFLPMRLGPRILRTETAAIAALSVLQATYGDLL